MRYADRSIGRLGAPAARAGAKPQDIAVKAFAAFGVSTCVTPELAAPGGEMRSLRPFLAGVQAWDDTIARYADPERGNTVPCTGLEDITRTYAKIIDCANRLPSRTW